MTHKESYTGVTVTRLDSCSIGSLVGAWKALSISGTLVTVIALQLLQVQAAELVTLFHLNHIDVSEDVL